VQKSRKRKKIISTQCENCKKNETNFALKLGVRKNIRSLASTHCGPTKAMNSYESCVNFQDGVDFKVSQRFGL